ncbi:MAG: lipoate--protein ligase [Eubacteriales bacterium]|jgi:lipoate-protein ligase A|nr:lipoate--protein ligase [Eubacteriales bacterium]MDD4716950.1 lipoate--protein ligase [Eubacteriales bacterium]
MLRSKAEIIHSDSTDPWFNLALEDHLVDKVSAAAGTGTDLVILYLWQNADTVVIGRNQNAWTECRTELLEEEGGKLARRSTGGGAVFHDLGNLNFSIITPKSRYDTRRSLGVIVEAVKEAGVNAHLSGRNDILADDLKFSGNAFLVRKEAGLHHGTILVSSDYARIGRYLNVPKAKLEAKGIKSVKARVVNLSAIKGDIDICLMKTLTEKAFIREYRPDETAGDIRYDIADPSGFRDVYDKYSSWEWRYGETMTFSAVMEQYFEWGNIQLCFSVTGGTVTEARIYTDALDSEFFMSLSESFKGKRYTSEGLLSALDDCCETPAIKAVTGKAVSDDIAGLFRSQMI